MKKLLFAAMVAGLAVSAQAQTTFTQVWSIKTDVGGGPAWFQGGAGTAVGARAVRSAVVKASSDKLLVVRRLTNTSAELRKLNPATGAELGDSPQPLVDQGASGSRYGVFCANMIDTADDDVIYISNLSNLVSRIAIEPFIIFRMVNDTDTPTTALEITSFAGGTNPELGNIRLGDTLQAVGSGTATEIFAGVGHGQGVATTNEVVDLVRFTTTNGTDFSVANAYALQDSASPFTTLAPNRLGLAVFGSGASAEVWGDSSGDNLFPRKYNLTTLDTVAGVGSAVYPMAFGHTGLGLTEVAGQKLLVSAPGAYTSNAGYTAPLWNIDSALSAYVYNVTNAAAPTLVGKTEYLGNLVSGQYSVNADGTSDVFFDASRNNFGVVLVNSSISVHNFGSASVQDWNLF